MIVSNTSQAETDQYCVLSHVEPRPKKLIMEHGYKRRVEEGPAGEKRGKEKGVGVNVVEVYYMYV
jgi:hypothetical protein